MAITHLRQLSDPAATKRLVIKVGSALLVGANGQPRHDWLAGLVAEVAALRAAGQQVVLVSSGAIALGAARMGLAKGGRGSLADAQAAASVGQIALSGLWSHLLEKHGLGAAQMLGHLGREEDARRLRRAIVATMEARDRVTPDLGGSGNTRSFAEAIAERVSS